ncbi:MAG: glycosyltransferase family 2 protein [Desulfosporosinus sp.]|nr:glycosyltransferase family 2 protein [Desulfosporosinus sp.]
MLSIITPAYNEVLNLPILRERLATVLGGLSVEWEWIIIDDGSRDGTYALICQWAATDRRIRGARLSRNYGSHSALTCGMGLARGEGIVSLAADLQDPPEIICELYELWRIGAKVVWAVPQRDHTGLHTIFYSLLRRGDGLADHPLSGSGFVLIDRAVAEVLNAAEERNSNLFARIRLAGFSQDSVSYRKAKRNHGRSGWTQRKKLKLALDSLTGFDHALVRSMTYLGFLVAAVGFSMAIYVVALFFTGQPPTGWASIMTAILLLGGVQMIFLGVLGEYAWRTLDETRDRPLFVVEAATDVEETDDKLCPRCL